MTGIPLLYGSCHGLTPLLDPSWHLRRMMDGYSSGRKSVQDSLREVVVNSRMAGRGSRSIHCTLPVVSDVVFDVSDADMLVNSIAWAPYDLGPILGCASSDGKISVLSFQSRSPPQAILSNLKLMARRRLDRRIDISRTRHRSQRYLMGPVISIHNQRRRSPFPKHKSGHYAKAFRHWWIRQSDQDLGI